MTALVFTVLAVALPAGLLLYALTHHRQENPMTETQVGFRCTRCGQSLLHSQVQAGSPPRGYWVTLEDGHFGFDCPAGPGGHERPMPAVDRECVRRFELIRHEDVSGVSGIGLVAEGVAFSDGTAVIHWVAGEHRSTVVWPDVAGVEAIHGHGGATQIRWVDA